MSDWLLRQAVREEAVRALEVGLSDLSLPAARGMAQFATFVAHFFLLLVVLM